MPNAASPIPSASAAQPTSTNAATASAAISQKTVAAGDETSGSSRFNSLADLKEKSPKVYNAMMVGIAQNICRDMEDGQQRLKRLMEEGRRNNS